MKQLEPKSSGQDRGDISDVHLLAGSIARTEQKPKAKVIGRIGLTNVRGHALHGSAGEAVARTPATIDVLSLQIGQHHVFGHRRISG